MINYIIDVYLVVSASALAATVVARSAFGAGFPVGVVLGPVGAVLTRIQVIFISDVRKTRTTVGILSRWLYRTCDGPRTIYLDKVRVSNPIQIQICTPTAIIEDVQCLDELHL